MPGGSTAMPRGLAEAAAVAAAADGVRKPAAANGSAASAGAAALERAREAASGKGGTGGGGGAAAVATAAARAALAAHVPAKPAGQPPAKAPVAAPASKPLPPLQPATASASATATSTAATASSGSSKKKGPPLRRGKWTPEEEAYANRLIQEFKSGLLPLTDGTTLRTFLSKLLNCDPMRISKKFVGNNCIGKQVFRRRTADINRLTPEQIQQSRGELSELERRFLERVAQTNRVKSSGGVGTGGGGGGPGSTGGSGKGATKMMDEVVLDSRSVDAAAQAAMAMANGGGGGGAHNGRPPSPPWLRPPANFKPGNANRAAVAGRALLDGGSHSRGGHDGGQANALLMAALQQQQRQSQQNLLQSAMMAANAGNSRMGANTNSASNLLAAAMGGAGSGDVNNALAQMVRTASAAKLSGGNASIDNLMLKTGLSRDQLSQLARDQSLSNLMERQTSFDALMSLDFQSLQSIDNLANLIQTGAQSKQDLPKSGLKNWDGDGKDMSSPNLAAAVAAAAAAASGGNGGAASDSRMENLIRSLSSGNVGNKKDGGAGAGTADSNADFNALLRSLQSNSNLAGAGASANNLFGSMSGSSAMNLASMLRTDSSTGLTALRVQDGLAQRNTSVDDFLSLVANGDIPHQDPHLLNVPLQSVMQQQAAAAAAAAGGNQAAGAYLAQLQQQQQHASLGNLAGNASVQNLLSQLAAGSAGNLAAAALMGEQAGAAAGGSRKKRKLDGDGQQASI